MDTLTFWIWAVYLSLTDTYQHVGNIFSLLSFHKKQLGHIVSVAERVHHLPPAGCFARDEGKLVSHCESYLVKAHQPPFSSVITARRPPDRQPETQRAAPTPPLGHSAFWIRCETRSNVRFNWASAAAGRLSVSEPEFTIKHKALHYTTISLDLKTF